MSLRRYAVAAAVLATAAAVSAMLTPPPENPGIDPSLDLRALSPVPAAIMGLMSRACLDCHSDATRWPWYSKIPPASWLVAHDVREARSQVNFSRWGEYNALDRADKLDEACTLVSSRDMPLWSYRLLHPRARLSDQDIRTFCEWTESEARRLVQGAQ